MIRLPRPGKTLGTLLAVFLAALAFLAAARVARSMRRGRGATFSLARGGPGFPQTATYDFLAQGPDAQFKGLSADEAWVSLLRCPGLPPVRESEHDRRATVVLSQEGRPTARRALHLGAGASPRPGRELETEADFTLVLPASATLSFQTGARAEAGGKLLITLDLRPAGGAPITLHSRKILFTPDAPGPKGPSSGAGLEAGWQAGEADLSAWAGRSVTIRFKGAYVPDPNVSLSSATAHVFWAAPALWVPDARHWARPGLAKGAAGRSGPKPPQNVLWVVFESFPTPSLHGTSVEDFPGLDFLGQEGIEFQRVYANQMDAEKALRETLSSRATEDGGRAAGLPEPDASERAGSRKQARPFPAVLREAGYQTALFGAPGTDPSAWSGLGFDTAESAPPPGAGAEGSVREAARWLASNGGRGPYFVMVFVRRPGRFEDPSPRCWLRALHLSPGVLFSGRRWRALAQAVQMDGPLARLWNQEKNLAAEERTLLTATSLRGTSFREEPLRRLGDERSFRAPLPRPGLGLREEEVRVVWLTRPPGLLGPRTVTDPAQLLDVAPTLTVLLGLSPEPGAEGRPVGVSARGAGPSGGEAAARFLIEGGGGNALVLDGHYKYIRRGPSLEMPWGAGARVRTDFEPEELYDLWADPAEERNLARRRRDLLARARRAMDEHRPERTAMRYVFRGFTTEAPLQGVVTCPGGDLWNVSLSTGTLTRSGPNQVVFTVAEPEARLTFETWPPEASFICSLRSKGRSVPAAAFVVSRFGLPLVEGAGEDWFDGAKFPWMEGIPPPGPASVDGPRVYVGRDPLRAPPPEAAP